MAIFKISAADNVLRLVAAFVAFDYDVTGLAEYAPQVPTLGLPLRVIDEPFILDVMTHVNGLTFDTAYAHHETCDLDGLEIHLIHRNDLVLNKLSSGREKDLADVRSLQFIEAYWNGQKLEVYEKPTPQHRPESDTREPKDSAAE